MIKTDNVVFGRVKYTAAGRKFVQSQSQETQKILKNAEGRMKNFKYTNLVVNANGYSIQHLGENGKHCYSIDKILFSVFKDVIFHVKTSDGIFNKIKFNLNHDKKLLTNCAVASSEDARHNNKWLNSSIALASLIEKDCRCKSSFIKNIAKTFGF